jgi:two-component system response regulator RegX3
VQARILIVEDDPEYAELTSMYLTNEGVTVEVAPTGEIAIEKIATEQYDIVLLDINLPGMDGFEALSELRRHSDVPVIIVSAREADEDVVMGLSAGADEFVSKPVSPRVLAARVRALMRRVRQSDRTRETYRFGPFRFEPDSYLLEKDGERIQLSSREYEVLRYLIEQDGKPRTPEEVFREVWPHEHGDVTTVAVYVQRLRRKLGDDPDRPRYIETVRGRGYRFNTDELSRQGGYR